MSFTDLSRLVRGVIEDLNLQTVLWILQRTHRCHKLVQNIRLVLAPLLVGAGLWSVATAYPVAPLFIALKVTVFGIMSIVGLVLRAIMKNWAIGFRRLATEGPSAAIDAIFQGSLERARYVAYCMRSLSGVMAVLGVVKPA